jgi:hypothetical protein
MELSEEMGRVRVAYFHEGDVWWARTSLQFSAADDDLDGLKQRVHAAMEEIFGDQVILTEVTYDPSVRPLHNTA